MLGAVPPILQHFYVFKAWSNTDLIYGFVGGLGVTAGAHRYWTHKSYKAKLPLRIILATLYLTCGMNSIFDWVRDHRIHHKFTETDADPHNAKRGLFFSHVGWLMQKKHPEVLRRGRQIDMSDVLADPVVQFEERYFKPLLLIFSFLIPVSVPCLLWGETWWNATLANILRWVVLLNCIWAVNSFAHIYGLHPYNRKIQPADNRVVSAIALGEGWHNYHHTFPWDYKTSELGDYGLNVTTGFIDFFAYIGWAYDRKQPSENLIQKVVQQAGDGTHPKWGHVEEVSEEAEQLLNASNEVEDFKLNSEDRFK
ncbi:acyl-CoA Delta(11) desaturase-like isoform X2 [Zootermopsis nevadensis]|uniref:acyl-CoA Delta(11) desaturase-like isoform X2 n=1 Tax=Zootermopsis nevadensis TaxID=136037 RepID=UPI000B8E77C0|nr:acyl-CoA Delta(11) desaturase-like isoform X2 [Zootermopsis nevadensis]